ncbi:MAG: EthD family reductase [Deltaproteobacteria bacterium]|nr:EthD family reductase [Deltaproteobacteria bacterium]
MSAAFLVIYEGHPEDPEAFVRYYVEKHVPIVWTFPKIRRIEIDRGVDGGDFFMVTRLTFDTIEDLRVAINSRERERARADMRNFPPFEGTVRRQAVEIMDLPRP